MNKNSLLCAALLSLIALCTGGCGASPEYHTSSAGSSSCAVRHHSAGACATVQVRAAD